MDKEKIYFETPPEIEALIVQLAEIRNIKKPLESKENYLKKRIKTIAADIGCDEFVAERGGIKVTIAYLKDAPPRVDNNRLKYEFEEIYNKCLIQPGLADRYLYTTDEALQIETTK